MAAVVWVSASGSSKFNQLIMVSITFPNDLKLEPEAIVAKWDELTRFGESSCHLTNGSDTFPPDERATYPNSSPEAIEQMVNNIENVSVSASSSGKSNNYEDPEDTKEIIAAKRAKSEPSEITYTERDIMLYNLGIGAKADELQWVYENADDFAVSLRISQFRTTYSP